MGPSLRLAVLELSTIDDAGELELAAAQIHPLTVIETLDGVVEEAIALIEETPNGYPVLRAMAAAAAPPVTRFAAAAAARLEESGSPVLPPALEHVGGLAPERAWWLEDGSGITSLTVACRRPGADGVQILSFTFEWPLTDGAIKDGVATPTVSDADLAEVVFDRSAELGLEPEEIPPAEAVERLARGARRCRETELGPPSDAFPAVALLLRAGRVPDAEELLEELMQVGNLAEAVEATLEDDEDELRREIDAFVERFKAWYEAHEPDDEALGRAVYIAGAMADYRTWYADGSIHAWNAADLEEFLLGWVPRKVGVDDEDIEHVPATVAEVLRFLGETGSLPVRQAEALDRRARALTEEFALAARDPRRFGPAKAISEAMRADGIDVFDQAAVAAWIERFNELPREERDRRAPALAQPPFLPAATSPPTPGKTRPNVKKARKAQRRARDRSRRRG